TYSESLEADGLTELAERPSVSLFGTDVVSGREQVARVEADADAPMTIHLRDDRGELLERRSQCRPLAGSVLEYHHRSPAPVSSEQAEERLGNEIDSGRRVAIRVAAGMEHDAEQSQGFSAIDLVGHR